VCRWLPCNGLIPAQGVVLTVYTSRNWKSGQGPTKTDVKRRQAKGQPTGNNGDLSLLISDNVTSSNEIQTLVSLSSALASCCLLLAMLLWPVVHNIRWLLPFSSESSFWTGHSSSIWTTSHIYCVWTGFYRCKQLQLWSDYISKLQPQAHRGILTAMLYHKYPTQNGRRNDQGIMQ
jgi:hypothetical protein